GGFTVTRVIPVPTITGISPSAGSQGATFAATITGTDLNDVTSVTFSGTGVTATIGNPITATSIPVTITIASSAALGARTITATTPGATSPPFSSFRVDPPPAITNISPSSGIPGSSFPATITGTLLSGATGVSISGTG